MPQLLPALQKLIQQDVSIQRLAEARGIKLERSGKELIGPCPFHEDIHFSLSIDPERNVWHCRGACGGGGDVIQWVMRAEAVSFRHAVELLRRDYLPSAPSPAQPPPRRSTVPKLPPLFEDDAEDQELLQTVSNYYHDTLKQTPEAQQYLIRRGLQSAEMVDRFRLGFSNRTLNYRIPDRNRVAGGRQRGRLEEMGIFRKGTGHEHFVGSLVIPICNLNGEVVQMYGRKINSHLRPGTEYHVYLPEPPRTVWNEAVLIASKEVILCEALIDALTFWCAGFRNVTTSYGVNGLEDCHREAFQRHGRKRIYIAYDRDEAGDCAATQHGEELMSMGIDCFRVLFPKGMDANEFALKATPAAKALGLLLNKSEWLGKGKLRATVGVEASATANPTPMAVTEAEEQPSGAIKQQARPTAVTEKPPPKLSDSLPKNGERSELESIKTGAGSEWGRDLAISPNG